MKITQAVVDEAYQKVLVIGDKPTVRRVQEEIRKELGKAGSSDDIARMLRVIKAGGEKTLTQRVSELENEVKDLKLLLEKCNRVLQC